MPAPDSLCDGQADAVLSGLVVKKGSVARLRTSPLIPLPESRMATTSQFRGSM